MRLPFCAFVIALSMFLVSFIGAAAAQEADAGAEATIIEDTAAVDTTGRQTRQTPTDPPDSQPRAFAHKLIYAETPDIGGTWRGGVRMTDVIMWEFFFNFNRWVTADLMVGGFDVRAGRDSAAGNARDLFWTLSLKSAPMLRALTRDRYACGLGLKLYGAQLSYKRHVYSADSLDTRDGAFLFFLTQRLRLAGRHDINLFSSFSFDSYGPSPLRVGSDSLPYRTRSLCLVPGYRFHIGRGWHAEFEYYLTNAVYLPLQSLQILGLGGYMENIDRRWIALLLWGIQFRGRHLYAGIHILNHWSFQPPFIPFISVGYNF